MKNVFIQYGVHIGNKTALTYIGKSILNEGHFYLTRLKREGDDKPAFQYKDKEYKSLAAAVRASRRWVHDVMGLEIEEAEEN